MHVGPGKQLLEIVNEAEHQRIYSTAD
jgi:hypothetical protein